MDVLPHALLRGSTLALLLTTKRASAPPIAGMDLGSPERSVMTGPLQMETDVWPIARAPGTAGLAQEGLTIRLMYVLRLVETLS